MMLTAPNESGGRNTDIRKPRLGALETLFHKPDRELRPPSGEVVNNPHEFPDRIGGFIQRGRFRFGQLNLDHLLDTAGAQFYGYADKEIVDAVFPFQQRCAGEDFLFVL
jgi:hypothetical protein